MNRLFAIIVAALAFAVSSQGQSLDEQYVRIYNAIQQADGLNNTGKSQDALQKYLEAQSALQRMQKLNPDWQPRIISFRLSYVGEKISALSTAPAPAPAPKPVAPTPITETVTNVTLETGPAPRVPSEAEQQLGALQEQVRQLAAEKTILEAKLKEAFATQPAAIDPRELARAEEKIQTLLKENAALKTNIDEEKNKPAPVAPEPDTKALDAAKREAAEASSKLTEQTARVASLEKERDDLAKKAQAATAATEETAAAKLALQEANRRLTDQSTAIKKLTEEKAALESRNALTLSGDAVDALRAENALLKQQLADANAAAASGTKTGDGNVQLAQAQARIALLQSEAEVLRLEKTALEDRLRKKPAGPDTAPIAVAETPRARDTRRIKQLETERDDLKQRLEIASTELTARKASPANSRLTELTKEIEKLRSRVDVYEARAVPYTAEELALFKGGSTTELSVSFNSSDAPATRKPARTLPTGAAALASEAQNHFAAREFDKAEIKYLEILKLDDKNAYTMANLAAIQMEMGKYDAAEKNVKAAIEIAPDDAYTLSILGYLKFRQEKYDDALDALSRAAKLNPQSAEIQNYLGVTLSHKGQRGPAETALRKAIQIDPNYAKAHNNLAVVYISQTPPLTQLAKWHYQKALAAGHERNAELEKLIEKPAAK